MWEIVAIGGGIAVASYIVQRLFGGRAARRRDAGSEADRFVLRVQLTRAQTLGSSVELGEPSHEPTLLSDEVTVVDDADQLVVIPADTTLHVREFEGGVRTAHESVTLANGTGRRYSFELPKDRKFWILDAPGWRGCLGTTDPLRRTLPPRTEGYEITTRLPPEPAVDEHGLVSVTMADLTMPLWMHGLEGPDDWLLGARAGADPAVAIAAFTDPYLRAGANTTRDKAVGSACLELMDEVWLATTARATAGIPIVIMRARIRTREALRRWNSLASWQQRFRPDTAIVWGAARADAGFDVRVRSGLDATETSLGGPLPAVRALLVAELERRGLARAVDEPGVCRRPTRAPVELDGAYASVCDSMFLLMMGHPNNQALSVQEPETQRQVVDLARELAEAAPADITTLVWIVSAIYAHGCGGLAGGQRDAVLAFVRARTADDDPIHRLAPAIYFRLGERGEAAAACERALAWVATRADAYRGSLDVVTAAYRTWVEAVRTKATA